jgi:hypothetical protein
VGIDRASGGGLSIGFGLLISFHLASVEAHARLVA